MILVTGATGTTGSELVRQLAHEGTSVKALVRSLDKARAIAGPNVEIAQGDLSDTSSLDAALRGVHKLFLLCSPDPRQVELQRNAIEAARRAGVDHIVKMGALGAHHDSPIGLARMHAQTEREIEDSGIPFTHLRPTLFMQSLFMHAPTIANLGAFYLPMRDGRISMIDARDIAAVARNVLTTDGHAGQTYTLTGPEALSMDQVAAKLGVLLGKPVDYVDAPPATARDNMIASGVPEWLTDDLLKLMEVFAAGHAAEVYPTVEEVTGAPARNLDRFLNDHIDAFAG